MEHFTLSGVLWGLRVRAAGGPPGGLCQRAASAARLARRSAKLIGLARVRSPERAVGALDWLLQHVFLFLIEISAFC